MDIQETASNFGTRVDKISKYNWVVKDAEVGVQMQIHKKELCIDEDYQRQLVKDKVLRIAKEWSWIACNVITVAHRNGQCFVIDGQHRVAAACKRSDIVMLPCIVFESSDVSQEAKGFLNANTNRKTLYSTDRLKALRVTGDESAILVENLVNNSGRKVARTATENTIACISTLMKWAKKDSSILINMWPLLTKLTHGHVFSNRVVEGLLTLEKRINTVHLYDHIWADRILRIGFDEIVRGINKATAFYMAPDGGVGTTFAKGILEVINKGLRNKLTMK